MSSRTCPTLCVLLIAACGVEGGDAPAPVADAGVRVEEDAGSSDAGFEDAGPRYGCAMSAPRAGQGYGGGPIEGRVVVFAVDERGAPLPGATVIAGGATATTDAEGCAQLDVAAGPVDVHVLMNGRRYVTWQAVPARELTVELRPVVWDRPTAALDGRVTGLDAVVSSTTAQVGRGAAIDTIDLTPYAGAPSPALRDDPELPENWIVQGAGLDLPTYRRVVYPEQVVGLFALAGPFVPERDGGRIDPTHIGVVTDVALDAREQRTLDVEITHALSERLEVRLPDTGGLRYFSAAGLLFLPGEAGVIQLARRGRGPTIEVAVPPLTGAFADATYGAFVRMQDAPASPSVEIDLVEPGSAQTTLTLRGVGVAPPEPEIEGRSFRAELAASDMVQLYAVGAAGWSTWVVHTAGFAGGDYAVTLPEVPEGLDDPVFDFRRVVLSVSDYADFDPSDELPLRDYFNGLRLRRQARRSVEIAF